MPAAEAHGLLDDPLEADEHRFGPVVAGDHHLGVPRQHRQLLLAALPAALPKSATHPALHGCQHSLTPPAAPKLGSVTSAAAPDSVMTVTEAVVRMRKDGCTPFSSYDGLVGGAAKPTYYSGVPQSGRVRNTGVSTEAMRRRGDRRDGSGRSSGGPQSNPSRWYLGATHARPCRGFSRQRWRIVSVHSPIGRSPSLRRWAPPNAICRWFRNHSFSIYAAGSGELKGTKYLFIYSFIIYRSALLCIHVRLYTIDRV
ncbi:hypothetical protein BHE74_00016764 [Ensete ventricosum]|nr:hypothetical protein BHE74_00016764 [Ensete ventricosum]